MAITDESTQILISTLYVYLKQVTYVEKQVKHVNK